MKVMVFLDFRQWAKKMNREIKFRCWDKMGEKMHYQEKQSLKEWFNRYGSNSFVMMQYTGFKDRKGKEVYEGDIINFTTIISQSASLPPEMDKELENQGYGGKTKIQRSVEFEKHECFNGTCYGYPFPNEDIEVTGNIYENPNLLK